MSTVSDASWHACGAQLTRSIIEDIAKGLAHLHKHDTWHGDLKSLNILLTAEPHRASVRTWHLVNHRLV